MYQNSQYDYTNSFEQNFVPINYGQDSLQTHALLRELISAVKKGQIIQIDKREIGRTAVNYIQGEEKDCKLH